MALYGALESIFKNIGTMKRTEPLIHSHITDCLPEDHPMAYEFVYCDKCGDTLHACNNECMQTWTEMQRGNFCTKCFVLTPVMTWEHTEPEKDND